MTTENKKRTTLTVSPSLLSWWKENSSIPLSSFLEMKMKQFSSSFKPKEEERKIKTSILLDNVSWIKKGDSE